MPWARRYGEYNLFYLHRARRHSGEGKIDRVAPKAYAGLHGIITVTWDGPGSLTARRQSVVSGHVEINVRVTMGETKGCYPVTDRHRTRPSVCTVEIPTKTRQCVSEREAQPQWAIRTTVPTYTKTTRDDATQSKSWYEPNRQA
jgi:hypothetical protein